jgi:hypothetical protein
MSLKIPFERLLLKSSSTFFLLLLFSCLLLNVKAQNFLASNSDNAISAEMVLQKFLPNVITIEKVSYDESHQNYIRLPKGFDLAKMHFLDMPSAQTTTEDIHIDEFLTSKGIYAKVMTYLKEESLGKAWANRPKFRILLPDKIVALDAKLNVLVETPNSDELKSAFINKGNSALTKGLFQAVQFKDMSLEDISKFEKEGFKFTIEDNEFVFKKEENLFVYNAKDMFVGGTQKEGDKWVQRFSFFQRHPNGYVMPKNTQTVYDDNLPTGVKIKRAEYVIVTNFQLQGERYKDMQTPSVLTASTLRVVPNPATDVLRCETSMFSSTLNEPIHVQVTDVAGKTLIDNSNVVSGKVFELNITTLPSGLYILSLRKGNQLQSTKFVKN